MRFIAFDTIGYSYWCPLCIAKFDPQRQSNSQL
jgi:hypothetical protein